MTTAYSTKSETAEVTTHPTCLYGVVLVDTGGGAVITVTDGNGGDTVLKLGTNAVRVTVSVQFTEPVILQNGIYLTVDSGTAPSVSFFYT